MPTITVLRKEGFGFTATDESGQLIAMDASPDAGGNNQGFRPMQGLLASLGGCSGIDVVNILNKQRQPLETLTIQISGEREHNVIPSLWKTIHLHFIIGGEVLQDKARNAIQLSVEKYCSVAETLRRAGCTITWDVKLLGKSEP